MIGLRLERLLWVVIGVVPGLLVGVWLGGFSLPSWEDASKVAPVGTAIIATLAAAIALVAMFVQRDTAKRRAAIDFFLKTEMDQAIVTAYEKFEELAPKCPQLVKRADFNKAHSDYKDLRRWLNICELIAVGVNQDAFSDRVSFDYWGDVLPRSLSDARDFITFSRKEYETPGTYLELEKLARKWSKRDARRLGRRRGLIWLGVILGICWMATVAYGIIALIYWGLKVLAII